jgi:hypothetical protein
MFHKFYNCNDELRFRRSIEGGAVVKLNILCSSIQFAESFLINTFHGKRDTAIGFMVSVYCFEMMITTKI